MARDHILTPLTSPSRYHMFNSTAPPSREASHDTTSQNTSSIVLYIKLLLTHTLVHVIPLTNQLRNLVPGADITKRKIGFVPVKPRNE